MIEIFPADPYQPSSSSFPPPPPPPPWAQRADEAIPAVPEPFESEKIPQNLVSKVRPFLRVANQIEAESPRSAYLCRVHAFQRAHVMDPRSTGRGVRQFKTSLLKRLEKDHEATVIRRKEKSDVRELKSFYHEKLLVEAHEITSVLSEVLKVLESGAGPEIPASGDHIEARSVFNTLPLDSGGSQQAIMLFPEINAAVSAVCNVRGLPSPENNQEARTYADLLDWLQCWFGFQGVFGCCWGSDSLCGWETISIAQGAQEHYKRIRSSAE